MSKEKMFNCEQKDYIINRLKALGAADVGFCLADRVERIPCRAEQRIPAGAKVLIVAVFGYYSGEYPGRNVAKYAIPNDYHKIIGDLLKEAVADFEEHFPNRQFAGFCDVSPFNETQAAQIAGLGVVGKNGLLINKETGLYHFIGEIATTMELEPSEPSEGECLGCDRCTAACPTGAIGAADKQGCLSAVTQRKGELTAEEQKLMRKTGTVWGCDICIDVCPMNGKRLTEIAAFKDELLPVLEQENVKDALKKKAWGYRGISVIKRNLAAVYGEEK